MCYHFSLITVLMVEKTPWFVNIKSELSFPACTLKEGYREMRSRKDEVCSSSLIYQEPAVFAPIFTVYYFILSEFDITELW